MRLPNAIEKARTDVDKGITRSKGDTRSIMPFEYDKTVASSVSNVSKLPALTRTTASNVQDVSGNFYFVFGFSEFGSGHTFR